MKQATLIFLLCLSLAGCSTLQGAGALGSVAMGVVAVISHLEGKEDREKALKVRDSQMESLCVSQLQGSVDKWPTICPASLSKMDACSRIDFKSPLCDSYYKAYEARFQSKQTPPQEIARSAPKKAEKKVVAKAPTAKKQLVKAVAEKPKAPQLIKAVAKKQKKSEPRIIKVKLVSS